MIRREGTLKSNFTQPGEVHAMKALDLKVRLAPFRRGKLILDGVRLAEDYLGFYKHTLRIHTRQARALETERGKSLSELKNP